MSLLNIRTILRSPFIVFAVVFYLSMFILGSDKSLEKSLIWSFNDKVLHFVAYGFLTVLLFLGIKQLKKDQWDHFQVSLMTMVVGFVLGALDECMQYFVNRDNSFDDWVADAGGIVVCLAGLNLLYALFWKKHDHTEIM